MKNSFAPVFSKILDSSIWEEPYGVRVLFLAMLVLQDSDHVVRFNAFGLGKRANMPEAEVIEALKILENPDKRRLEEQEHQGRRIQKVDGGWLVLNGQYYEDQMRTISRQIYQARKQREYRDRKASKPLPGELAALKAKTPEEQDAITAAALPSPTAASVPKSATGPVGPLGKPARPSIAPRSTLPAPLPSVPAPNPPSHPTPPAARAAAAVVPAVLKQLRRVQSAPNPVFGGWQQKEIGTGTAAPVPLPAAGSPAPAAAHSPSSDEPSEEEPPTE